MTKIVKKIKVIVIDDSGLIRALLREMLNSDERVTVVAEAQDAFEARELIKKHNPDVITLDIEMPKMNGILFLKNLMRLRPMPVIMISTLTQEGAPATMQALELGAVDYVPKPKSDGDAGLEGYRETIIEKVVAASRARVRLYQQKLDNQGANECVAKNAAIIAKRSMKRHFICAIGASTGGTEAIKEVIASLPSGSPPVVVVQHIPESFSASYAARVDSCSVVKVFEARNNQKIESGCVYIAPGNMHLKIALSPQGYICKLDSGDAVNRHRPSVEVLFDSVLEVAGKNAMGVILTGMGADGAEALLRMKNAGCITLAQDEETSVVWGMPGASVKIGAASKVLPLGAMAKQILTAAST